jgi:16S rRNA (cytosine967-C5)-methyltransferase
MWPLLKPGGRLVYASCSALRAENEAVVAGFLGNEPGARDITAAVVAPLGLPPAFGVGYPIAAGTAAMDGFYYACLEKSGSGD